MMLKTFRNWCIVILLTGIFGIPESAASVPEYPYYGKKPVSQSVRRKIAALYEMIVADINEAEHQIDSLRKKLDAANNPDLNIDLLLLEAEMYRSKGDYIHMKLSYYQALSWKTSATPEYYSLYLDFFKAINAGLKGKGDLQCAQMSRLLVRTNQKKYPLLKAKIYHGLGRYYSNNGDYEKAHQNYIKARNIYRQLGFFILRFDIKIARGITFFRDQKFQESIHWFHDALRIADSIGSKKCYANALISLAEANLFIPGNLDSARAYMAAFERNISDADERDVLNYYWTKEHYFRALNQMDSAYHYLNIQVEKDDEIRSRMVQATQSEIDAVFKRLQNERKLRNDREKEKSLKIVFVVIGIFLLCFIGIMWLVIKEKGRYSFMLMTQKDEILHKKKQIDIALREKELLLKEIHHRVKNNLQIISSLLSLQSKNIDDETARQAILEGKERIQAIALIHHKLYQNDTFATIDMETYLSDLVMQLERSYNESESQVKIVLETHGIILNIDTVVPLGLIICELVTNAFKYAFKKGEPGKLKVEISKDSEDSYQLLVKDNGIGMMPEFNYLESPTLGVEIVTALTEQLDGQISYKTSDRGTSIRIRFKEIKNT